MPVPRRGSIGAPLYMCWLEMLSDGLDAALLLRGNQESVLTLYS